MAEKNKIHFVGVGGVGMGSLAIALADQGHKVTGSDGALYEPMKGVLTSAKIELLEGFTADNIKKVQPDFVVIGNVVRKDNPEVKAWLNSQINFLSFPEAVRKFIIQNKQSIVCAGTHGKTTTTSWGAFLLKELGLKPSYLIGGVPKNLDRGCVLTEGDYFIGEGDEYDSAFFDKGPKFLHYDPKYLILSYIEFDHADIYKDLDHVKSSFRKLVSLLPGDGLILARYEDSNILDVTRNSLCPVQTYGFAPQALWRIGKIEESEAGFKFEILYRNRSMGYFETPLFGEYNLLNLISGIALAINLGQSVETIRKTVPQFLGARRRQEVLQKDPILVIDDFAHHPTEVTGTLKAVRRRYPTGKLWALFEPRSATARRSTHQAEYPAAFQAADHVVLSFPHRVSELKEEERFSVEKLVEDLKAAGKEAVAISDVDEIIKHVTQHIKPGDRIVIMSNGEFGKIQEKLIHALK